MITRIFTVMLAVIFTCGSAYAMCGMCGADHKAKGKKKDMFAHVAKEAKAKDGVKEISYDQLKAIRDSGEKYILLDVLSKESYNSGHIKGAASFPLDTINKETASKRLSKGDHIVVYCGSFQCSTSTDAAKKLSGLGYNVLDYKGGLKEWQEKGNKLVTKS